MLNKNSPVTNDKSTPGGKSSSMSKNGLNSEGGQDLHMALKSCVEIGSAKNLYTFI